MKKTVITLLTTLAILQCITPAFAYLGPDVDIDFQDLGPQEILEEAEYGPFNMEFLGDVIGEAKVKSAPFNKLSFATAMTDVNATYYYDPYNKEALGAGLSYIWTKLHCKNNPFFSEEIFNTLSLSFTGFSQRIPNWTWRSQLSINFDNLDHWNLADYMNYDFLIWGRYDCSETFALHLGFIAMTGMKIDRVYPIIGFDWKYNCNWKFSFAFPIDMSIVYSINDIWNIALAGRTFNQRHRVDKNAPLPKALWFYTTNGLELALNYLPTKKIKANIHLGFNSGGHLKIASHSYRHPERYKVESAGYAGADIDVNF